MKKIIPTLSLLLLTTFLFASSGPGSIGGLSIKPKTDDVPNTLVNDTEKSYQFVITNSSNVATQYRIDNLSTDLNAKFIAGTCQTGSIVSLAGHGSCTFSVDITAPSSETPSTFYSVMRLATNLNRDGTAWGVTYSTTSTPPPPTGDLEFDAVSGFALPNEVLINSIHQLKYTLTNTGKETTQYLLKDDTAPGIFINWSSSTCTETGGVLVAQKSCEVDMTFTAPGTPENYAHNAVTATNVSTSKTTDLYLTTTVYNNTPIHTLPGWPDYIAMGNISIGASVFKTTSGKDLDLAFTYNTINGDASIGKIIPNTKTAGQGWAKVYSLVHNGDTFSTPKDVIAFIVYYTDDAGSAAGSGFGNNGSYEPSQHSGQDDHESFANLTIQYINYINFLGIMTEEASAQKTSTYSLTAGIGLNPDLLGGLLQRGNNTDKYLNEHLGSIEYALSCAIKGTPPAGNSHACIKTPSADEIDPKLHTYLRENYDSLLTAIKNSDGGSGESGQAYLNSFNILSYFALRNYCGTDCKDISYGWHLNAWLAHGNANNIAKDPQGEGEFAYDFLKKTGLFDGAYRSDFTFFDKYEADGLTPSGLSNGYFWDAKTWDAYITFIHTIMRGDNKAPGLNEPSMLWQISASHLPEKDETGANAFPNKFGQTDYSPWVANRIDDNVNYFFGNNYGISFEQGNAALDVNIIDLPHEAGINTKYCLEGTAPANCTKAKTIAEALDFENQLNDYTQGHLQDLKDAGITAIMWGGGDGTRTTSGFCFLNTASITGACDAWNNPTGKTVNNSDHGWFEKVMDGYLTSVRTAEH